MPLAACRPAFGIDNQAPEKHRFISEGNRIFGNLNGPYRNVQSAQNSFEPTALSGTLEQVYYTIMHPVWEAAEAQNDYRGDLSTTAAWAAYRR